MASTYNARFSKTILQIIDEIQNRRAWIGVDWIEDSSSDESTKEETPPLAIETKGQTSERVVRLLDYACGTGLVSRVCLQPYSLRAMKADECRRSLHMSLNASVLIYLRVW